jgi:hypothetical protein
MRKLLFCKGIRLKKIPSLHDGVALQPVAEYAQAVVLQRNSVKKKIPRLHDGVTLEPVAEFAQPVVLQRNSVKKDP